MLEEGFIEDDGEEGGAVHQGGPSDGLLLEGGVNFMELEGGTSIMLLEGG